MNSRRIQNITATLILIGLILPFLIVGFYARPTADDFCNTLTSKNRTIIDSLIHLYNNWSGRFTHPLFRQIAASAVENIEFYKALSIFWIISAFACIKLFLSTLYSFREYRLYILSAFITVIWLANMPNLGQGIYWLTGARVYTMGIVLFVFYMSLFIRYYKKEFIFNKYIHIIINILILILSIGSSEPVALLALIFNSASLFYFKKNKVHYLYFALTILTICISFFAPGNFSRSTLIPEYDKIFLLKESVLKTIMFFWLWITNPSILFLGLGLYLFGPRIHSKIKNKGFVIALLFLSVIATGVFPSFFGVGGISSGRTMNPSYFAFLLLVVVVALRANNSYNWVKKLSSPLNKMIFITLLIVGVICSKNFTILIPDLYNNNFSKYTSFVDKSTSQVKINPLIPIKEYTGSKPKIFKYHTVNTDTSSCFYKLYTKIP